MSIFDCFESELTLHFEYNRFSDAENKESSEDLNPQLHELNISTYQG
jgi:hypothetical protein